MTQHAPATVGAIWAQARDEEGRPVIGADGSLPWRLPEDLAHFKAVTMGHPIVMGRRTWQSLPRRPLPGRVNVVITRDPERVAERADPAVVVAGSVEEAVEAAQAVDDEAWVIGGAQVYAAALDVVTRCVVTEVDAVVAGDAFAPELDKSWVAYPGQWRESATGLRYRVCEYVRD